MARNILVTGGFGFIGGHLVELLLKDPQNKVHVVDNLTSASLPLSKLLDEIDPKKNLSYTITSIKEYCQSSSSIKYDEIFHLGSVVGPAAVLSHAGTMVKDIIDDTSALIDLALRSNAKLVDVSSAEVYGGGQSGFCSEEFSKIVPAKTTIRLEYAVAKMAAEITLINTTKVISMKASIVRPFNVSGPRQSGWGGFVVPRLIASAIRNQPLTIFGDGLQVRAFTHVKDVVQGIVNTMKYGRTGEAYNLGNPENKTSISDFVNLIIALTGYEGKKLFIDPKTLFGKFYEEGISKFPDISKAMQELHWIPQLSNKEVILDTYSYMKRLEPGLLDLLGGCL